MSGSKANSAYSDRLKLLHDLIAGFEISGDSLDVIIILIYLDMADGSKDELTK